MIILAIIFGIIFTAIFLIVAFLLVSIISLFAIRIPYVNTPLGYMKKIIPELGIKKGDLIYDLGCGNGTFLVEALRYEPRKCVGYEIAPMAYFSAVLNTYFKGKDKIIIKMENFLKADISEVDLVYIYLIPRGIKPLYEKFKKELKPGAKFVCVGSPMPNWEPIKEIILNGDYKARIYQK